MRFELIEYDAVHSRQQEACNFHKVAARLADYGYASILLSDDYGGADFLAIHRDGDVLKVQLKSRFTLAKKYRGKGLHVAFRDGDAIIMYDHDDAIRRVGAEGKIVHTRSWVSGGMYSMDPFPAWARRTFADGVQ